MLDDTSYFTTREAWVGGYYELLIVLGKHNEERLLLALQALWDHPTLTGCYRHHDINPQDQNQIAPDLNYSNLHGLAQLPNGKQIAFKTYWLTTLEDGIDWLGLCLPLGSIGRHYPVGGYPFDNDPLPHEIWRRPIESWLTNIGQTLFKKVRFQAGLIDFEPGIDVTNILDVLNTEGLPTQRKLGYLIPENNELRTYPRNLIAL